MDADRRVPFGARLPIDSSLPQDELVRLRLDKLARLLNRGSVVAVVGAGASAALGYPTWTPWVAAVVDAASKHLASCGERGAALRGRLATYLNALRSGAYVEPSRLGVWLGDAMAAWTAVEGGASGGPSEENGFHKLVRDTFRLRAERPAPERDPFRALMGLVTVERFMTTNYDCEIERALAEAQRDCSWGDFGVQDSRGGPAASPSGRAPLSFTQAECHADRLAVFALARCGHLNRNMVFHAHGRCDDPRTVIATERQYQDAYLAPEREGGFAFAQTMDLLLRSNSILFVGYGLGDEDLLRPLRILSARRRGLAAGPMAFALVEDTTRGSDLAGYRSFGERYGVEVIPYDCPPDADGPARAGALVRGIELVRDHWLRWADRWREKPMLRAVPAPAAVERPYIHYAFRTPSGDERLGAGRLREVERLAALLDGTVRVLGIIGAGGTGKSWLALELIERMYKRSKRFEGWFFWSSYYARDRLTGLERLQRYLEPDRPGGVLDFARLRDELRARPILVVLDGFERLLDETDAPMQGRPTDSGVKQLLEVFTEKPGECASTLVITSRLWPETLGAPPPGSPFRLERMARLTSEELRRHSAFRPRRDESGPDRASTLCALLEGHAYGLALAARHLEAGLPTEDRYPDLVRRLAGVPPDGRLTAMIKGAIEGAEERAAGAARLLLERMAVFLGPVPESAIRACLGPPGEGRAEPGPVSPVASGHFDRALEALVDGSLLFEITSDEPAREDRRFVMHPTVRGVVRGRQDRRAEGDWPNFTLAGYTSGGAAVDPGTGGARDAVLQTFDRLVGYAQDALDGGDRVAARRHCRSAFAVLRSRMEANTLSRWTKTEDYIQRVIRVARVAMLSAERCWTDCDPHDALRVVGSDAPLYADELAWLYNDLGLALCAQGDMPDAYAVWLLGYEINRLIEGDAEVQPRVLQSQLHLAHVLLDMGRLGQASDWLAACEHTNYRLKSSDYRRRITGYLGLVAHLRGDFEAAQWCYGKARGSSSKGSGRNARSTGLFGFHEVALRIHLGEFEEATKRLREASAAVLAANHPDLCARAELTQGTLLLRQGDYLAATPWFARALREARERGIPRLEADVLSEQSRVALMLGDHATARQRAMESLAISNDLGLGLRQTTALVVLGRATLAMGERELGRGYLQAARDLGRHQGYVLRVQEAEQALENLPQRPQENVQIVLDVRRGSLERRPANPS